jgi:hypothetical protein
VEVYTGGAEKFAALLDAKAYEAALAAETH